jgi:hypothetical protein
MSGQHSDIEILQEESELVDPREYLADIPATLISGVFGLVAFMLACVVGVIAQNPGYVILLRAMLAMLICTIIGRIIGTVGEICIQEYVVKYKSRRPQPSRPQELVDLEAKSLEHARAVEHMKNTDKK